jgi:hypothetical protein
MFFVRFPAQREKYIISHSPAKLTYPGSNFASLRSSSYIASSAYSSRSAASLAIPNWTRELGTTRLMTAAS